jgi:hypothetical protein
MVIINQKKKRKSGSLGSRRNKWEKKKRPDLSETSIKTKHRQIAEGFT